MPQTRPDTSSQYDSTSHSDTTSSRPCHSNPPASASYTASSYSYSYPYSYTASDPGRPPPRPSDSYYTDSDAPSNAPAPPQTQSPASPSPAPAPTKSVRWETTLDKQTRARTLSWQKRVGKPVLSVPVFDRDPSSDDDTHTHPPQTDPSQDIHKPLPSVHVRRRLAELRREHQAHSRATSLVGRTPFRTPKTGQEKRMRVVSFRLPQEEMYPTHHGREIYAGRSLGCLSTRGRLRGTTIRIVDSLWFTWLVMFVILVNTVCIALRTPFDDPNGRKAQILDISELLFMSFFTIEMALKIVAFGLVVHEHAYLRNGWNVFDATLVFLGYLSLLSLPILGGHNFTALRSMRVLRPLRALRSIRWFKGPRTLVRSLLLSLPGLIDVTLLLLFLTAIYGLFGVQILKGKLHQRCYDATTLALAPNQPRYCSTGDTGLGCAPGQVCLARAPNPEHGIQSFDHFPAALVVLWNVMTLDAWSSLMYNLQDAAGPWVWLFFVSFTLMLSFFAINLFLAILIEALALISEEEAEYERAQAEAEAERASWRASLTDLAATAAAAVSGFAALARSYSLDRSRSDTRTPPPRHWWHQTVAELEAAYVAHAPSPIVWLNGVVSSPKFDGVVIAAIAANTLVLAVEHHGMSKSLEQLLDGLNVFFLAIFCLEIILRVLGSGWRAFLRDRYNIFDALIVLGSIVELVFWSSSSLSAFRILRLFRVARLLRVMRFFDRLQDLGRLLDTVTSGFAVASYVAALLLIVIVILAIVGMELFDGQFRAEPGRANFDSLWWSIVAVFQILTGDRSSVLMYEGMHRKDVLGTCYFIVLSVIGLILRFLFLAVIVHFFGDPTAFSSSSSSSTSRVPSVSPDTTQDEGTPPPPSITALPATPGSLAAATAANTRSNSAIIPPAATPTAPPKPTPQPAPTATPAPDRPPMSSRSRSRRYLLRSNNASKFSAAEAEQYQVAPIPSFQQLREQRTRKKISRQVRTTHADTLGTTHTQYGNTLPRHQFGSLADLARLRSGRAPSSPRNPHSPRLHRGPSTRLGSPRKSHRRARRKPSSRRAERYDGLVLPPALSTREHKSDDDIATATSSRRVSSRRSSSRRVSSRRSSSRRVSSRRSSSRRGPGGPSGPLSAAAAAAELLQRTATMMVTPAQDPADAARRFEEKMEDVRQRYRRKKRKRWRALRNRLLTEEQRQEERRARRARRRAKRAERRAANVAGVTYLANHGLVHSQHRRKKRAVEDGEGVRPTGSRTPLVGFACGMSVHSMLRRGGYMIVGNPLFGPFINLCICVNCVFMALDRPTLDTSSRLGQWIRVQDWLFLILFTIEILLKLVTFGVYWAEYGFFRDPWNRMDAAVVALSWLGLPFGNVFRGLRGFRALRPLRLIVKTANLRSVVTALAHAIPTMAQVLVVTFVFWLAFAIMGVTLFKGEFYACNDTSVSDRLQCRGSYVVEDPWQPGGNISVARVWSNADFSFDSTPEAMVTLMQVALIDGWADIMRSATDARGVDKQPHPSSQPIAALYFIVFIIFGSLFLLNLYIGVLLDYFTRIRYTQDIGLTFVTPQQRRLLVTRRILQATQPLDAPIPAPTNAFRRLCWTGAQHPKVDLVVSVLILINGAILCLHHYQEPDGISLLLKVSNIFFAIVFALEAATKITGLGRAYFRDPWNLFDFAIAIAGLINLAAVGPVLSAVRVLRLLRLARRTSTLHRLFNTLLHSLPSLWNIGSLVAVTFFVFALLGVTLFGRIKIAQFPGDTGFQPRASFARFDYAMLTLYKVATTDGWGQVMQAARIQAPDCNPDLDECGTPYATLYFVAFAITGIFVLVNLFMAVIVENFANNAVMPTEKLDVVHAFRAAWATEDPARTGYVTPTGFQRVMQRLPPPFDDGWRTSQLPCARHPEHTPDVAEAVRDPESAVEALDEEALTHAQIEAVKARCQERGITVAEMGRSRAVFGIPLPWYCFRPHPAGIEFHDALLHLVERILDHDREIADGPPAPPHHIRPTDAAETPATAQAWISNDEESMLQDAGAQRTVLSRLTAHSMGDIGQADATIVHGADDTLHSDDHIALPSLVLSGDGEADDTTTESDDAGVREEEETSGYYYGSYYSSMGGSGASGGGSGSGSDVIPLPLLRDDSRPLSRPTE